MNAWHQLFGILRKYEMEFSHSLNFITHTISWDSIILEFRRAIGMAMVFHIIFGGHLVNVCTNSSLLGLIPTTLDLYFFAIYRVDHIVYSGM